METTKRLTEADLPTGYRIEPNRECGHSLNLFGPDGKHVDNRGHAGKRTLIKIAIQHAALRAQVAK